MSNGGHSYEPRGPRSRVVEALIGVAVAVIAGLLVVWISGGLSAQPKSSSLPSSSPQPRASRTTPTITAKHTISASPSIIAASQASTPRRQLHVVVPLNQAGYTALWHRSISISLAGVLFQQNGPQPGNGSNFNLQYNLAGDPAGWDYLNGTFDYWQPGTHPGPADCVAENDSVEHAGYTIASIGSRYCFVSYDQAPIVVYMEVTAVNSSSVRVQAWAWVQNS
jgi:hypothetical protein